MKYCRNRPVKAWEPLDDFYRDPLKAAWAQDDSFVKVIGVDLAASTIVNRRQLSCDGDRSL